MNNPKYQGQLTTYATNTIITFQYLAPEFKFEKEKTWREI